MRGEVPVVQATVNKAGVWTFAGDIEGRAWEGSRTREATGSAATVASGLGV